MNKRPCMRRTIQPLLPIKFYEPFSFPFFASTLSFTLYAFGQRLLWVWGDSYFFVVPALLIVAEPYSRLYLFNAMLRLHSAMEISNLSRSSHETKRERESEKVSVKSRKSDKIRSCFVSMCELYPFECGAFLLYCAVLFRSQAYMCQPIKCLSCSATHLLIECSKWYNHFLCIHCLI